MLLESFSSHCEVVEKTPSRPVLRPRGPQILADQLTLSQTGGVDYAQYITTGTSGFSDPPTALPCLSLSEL